MLIGLTGQIGAGKSSVADLFAELGSMVISADVIGRRVLEDNAAVRRQLVRAFGTRVLNKRGKVDRGAVAKAAFKNQSTRETLNKIVHPLLLEELRRQTHVYVKTRKTVVIDAALLLEWKLDRRVDCVVVVQAPARTRLARMTAKGFKRADILRRMKLQADQSEFLSRADYVVTNTTTRAALRKQVIAVWRRLQQSS
ncbi:MAG: dephospho-CoA kinase [candidate division Zixibacteria bacterium]|nr:dephospho-CoA kinase [candidate division Zixibacteria bacterium]